MTLMPCLIFQVAGKPAPQGSKRGFVVNGRVNMVENSKKVDPWRSDVAMAAHRAFQDAMWPNLLHSVPISVEIEFVMPRPTGTPKSRPTPPAIKKNADIDKLVRSTLDALTDVVFTDDCLVVECTARKRIAEIGEGAGARIRIEEMSWPIVPTVKTRTA